MDEKREYSRIKISFPVRCEGLERHKPFYTVFKDISKGGLKLISEEFLSVNSFIKFEINLINNLIKGKGKIVWCNPQAYAERYWAGLEFTEINTSALKTLSDFLSNINST
ncbi:MAG: PilZ domain-containing protein [Candidatus Omnitrophica bacterium]|nr:PilZ domain-containing protein [Candidatus Omnitrophota bacterium]